MRAGTAETTETTERIFDTLFRCRLFRLCGLKKNLPKLHNPNFLSEGVRFGSDTKTGGWDILSVFPIRQFDLRVEDDPLSQEINYPPAFLHLYPAFVSNSMTLSRWSPWMIISPSLAVPPTPQLFFSSLPRASRSSEEPTKPRTTVATRPPLRRSSHTLRFCLAGGRVASPSSEAVSYSKFGFVEKTTPNLSFQSDAIYLLFNCAKL